MKINNLSFITPLIDKKKYVLDKEYSENIALSDESIISIASNIGPREEQEDSVAFMERHGYLLLLVADGVGGQEKGNEASYITAQKIQKWFSRLSKRNLEKLDEYELKTYVTAIINHLKEYNLPNESGTTLNMSIIGPNQTFIVNIGDSRTYSIKCGKIALRTRDDSMAFKKFNPQMSEERDILRFYENNNYITQSIGKKSLAIAKVTTLNNDDYDILCHVTDGVSDILSEKMIKEKCLNENAAKSLVDSAINSEPLYSNYNAQEFTDWIYPHDNASAIVYTKKRTKNNR